MAQAIVVPRLGWSMEQGKFIGWLKADGDPVRPGEPLFELEGEKAIQVVEAIDQGILCIPLDAPKAGEVVLVGAILGFLVAAGEPTPTTTLGATAALPQAGTVAANSAPAASAAREPDRVRISPRARRAALALGVDWKTVPASGSTGRIRECDILAAARGGGVTLLWLVAWLIPWLATAAGGQAILTGRLEVPIRPGSQEAAPLTEFLAIASLPGSENQALVGRTAHEKLPWDKLPIGGYQLAGTQGSYTLAFLNTTHFARPAVLTNLHVADGEMLERIVAPRFWRAVFDDTEAARAPANEHWATFTAQGRSVTGVGLQLAGDVTALEVGVDRSLVVSIHAVRDATRTNPLERFGPAIGSGRVPAVDLRGLAVRGLGAREFPWSCGWPSGEVQVEPGKEYAVRIGTKSPQAVFLARWVAVAGDGDGLLLPCRSKVHRLSTAGTKFAPRWVQTYRAQGRSLCAVVLHAACGGEQIPITRQRLRVRVRRENPGGPVVGVGKIATGIGNWTGDASWGFFAVAFAPGEVPLEPGSQYAIEFESLESAHTLKGFVNIKNVPGGEVGGFTPYRSLTDHPGGTAHLPGEGPQDFDLDLEVVEYEHASQKWSEAVDSPELLAGSWREFAVDPGTEHSRVVDDDKARRQLLRVLGGSFTGKTADGGFVQRAIGLSHGESYSFTGQVRSTWALDAEHQCFVGFDPTGQDTDPLAKSIVWKALPPVHGHFVDYHSPPIRPAVDAVSLWLRARTTTSRGSPIAVKQDPFGFRADFTGFSLQRVATTVPRVGLLHK